MSFSIGIVGLPNVGKSTLFKALTKIDVEIASHPFTTINPNIGIIQVPDERLEKIAQIIKPEKITPTTIQFIDIAGLIKDAHKGEGLGNQFLAQIRNCDAILEVVRAFENPEVENMAGQRDLVSSSPLASFKDSGGKINPQNDIEIIKTELELKDLEIKERASGSHKEQEKEEEKFLTKKPIFYLLNTDNKTEYNPPEEKHLAINLRDELEMIELSESEKKELGLKSRLDLLIIGCYNVLDLITFFTVAGDKETRAWTLKRGSGILEAGKSVHTDFKEKFIRAEVISWQRLIDLGSWKKAKESGEIKTIGKDYLVQDGDIIEFKIQ